MITKKVIASVFIVSVLFVSCKKELQPQDAPASRTEITNEIPTEIENLNNQNAQDSNANQQQLSGMNPPHGEPNHRCDIAVGAPLNSAPSAAPSVAAPEAASQPQQSVTTSTPAGMNPPHGQAGHRCEIAVGAPLPK